MKNIIDKPSVEPSENFKVFMSEFENAWNSEKILDANPISRNNWEYELYANDKIFIYYYNKQNLTAKLEMTKVWCNDVRLLEMLRRILPKYLEYFNNNLDFIKGYRCQ